MTLSNRDLVEYFRGGRTKGSSCNMEIKEIEINGRYKGTIIVGYQWAVYSHRTPNGNKITVFPDWYGFSKTTSSHINLIVRYSNNKIRGVKPTYKYPYAFRRRGRGYKEIEKWDSFPYDSLLESKVESALDG